MHVSGNPDASVSLLNVKDAQETAYLALCFKPPAKRRFLGPFTCLKGDQDGLRGRSQHLLRMLSLTWERLCGPFVTSQSTDAPEVAVFRTPEKLWLSISIEAIARNRRETIRSERH